MDKYHFFSFLCVWGYIYIYIYIYANLQAFEEPGAGILLLWEEMAVTSMACFAGMRLEKEIMEESRLCKGLATNEHRN